MRENDKIKEDTLVHLSDQLLVLSERIQEIERSQTNNRDSQTYGKYPEEFEFSL